MSEIDKIKNNQEQILIGEIGALLHDIGKMHPNFVKKQSKENTGEFRHTKIDEFLDKLAPLIRNPKFTIKIHQIETSIYHLITEHHGNDREIDGLVKALKICDHKDSADDKGIVRKKQPMNNTIISSPFGHPKEKIDLNCLQKKFDDLQKVLFETFTSYISENLNLICFRKSLINILKTAFTHALGETRIPSNDVTLWDHSYSTASLFKSALVTMVCVANISQNPTWRIFSIFWDGIGFINTGKKIADIKARNEIIENIKKKLKNKFEEEIPIGNAIYEDINGICFTFPEFNAAKNLAKECANEALKIIFKESDNEITPFFKLSKAASTLIIVADELEFASKKRNIPRMSSMLFIESQHEESFENPELIVANAGQDTCPICGIRSKKESKERCEICEKRRSGRLSHWLGNRENTIWIDEVADKNSRVALVSVNFDLYRWLDGTMVGTIFSQTYENWVNSKNWEENKAQMLQKCGLRIEIKADKESVYEVVQGIISFRSSKSEIVTNLLNTFYEEIPPGDINQRLQELGKKIGIRDNQSVLNALKNQNKQKELATFLFTQNPSPARLYRIWQETEEFFNFVVDELRNDVYATKRKRLSFEVKTDDLLFNIERNIPYIIKVNGLEPGTLLVFHESNGRFYTIESLEKFEYDGKTGIEAVTEALSRKGIDYIVPEEESRDNLLKGNTQKVTIKISKEEEYYPFIEITKSPLSLRLLVPTLDSMKIINLITKSYNERFKKVLGKLPLNIKLLVAKRKFPLYVLLDAEKRMLEDEEFRNQVAMDRWWDIDQMREDPYYGFYPTNPGRDSENYTLDDLHQISERRIFYLYPGYFDFELLQGTADRYNIYYENKKRGGENYKLFAGRPYYFHQVSQISELWDILIDNLSSSQINFVEEMLISKLYEWRSVKDPNKQNVFKAFAEATLKDAFGNKWDNLRQETRIFLVNSTLNGLLIDTIILFRHIIKEGVYESE